MMGRVTLLSVSISLACCGHGGSDGPTTRDGEPIRASCGASARGGIRLTETESGLAVTASVGQELLVSLPVFGSCGCSWSLQMASGEILSIAGEPLYVWDQPMMPGSGGRACYRLTAVRIGQTALDFAYRRLGEANTPPYQTAHYDVTVR